MVRKNSKPIRKKGVKVAKPEVESGVGGESSHPERCRETGDSCSRSNSREDRAAVTEEDLARFSPLRLEVNQADTAILLLRSPERPILLAAAAALAAYGQRARGNLTILFDLQIVDSVTHLIRHEDLFIQRLALKLVALMSAVPNVQAHLLQDDTYIRHFTETLQKSDKGDVFLQESASRIIAELTSGQRGTGVLLQCVERADFLLDGLENEEPDVRKNCIEIIFNLLKDLFGLDFITKAENFTFDALYRLLDEPYPIIQELTLSAIERLVLHNADDATQENFRQSDGVQRLLQLLENEDWKGLHEKVLKMLLLSSENPKTAEFMNRTDATMRILAFVERTQDDLLRFRAFSLLVSLADSDLGKKVLHSRGLIGVACKYTAKELDTGEEEAPLTIAETEIQSMICRCFAKMIAYGPAAEEISKVNPMAYVMSLLRNEDATWPQRQSAAFALKQLLERSYENCSNLLNDHGQIYLMNVLEQSSEEEEERDCRDDVPFEFLVTVIQMVKAIATYSSLSCCLMNRRLFSSLASFFDPDNGASDEVKIAACDALGCFTVSIKDARELFIKANVPKKLQLTLRGDDEPVPVRNAACQLFLQLADDSLIANVCTQQGLLYYMLENQKISRLIPTWSSCIEALFDADLPTKFAYTGRLSFVDFTTDGFYVMRRTSCPFPLLEELYRLHLCPMEPIYVVNFGRSTRDGDDLDCEPAGQQAAIDNARESIRRQSLLRGMRVSDATIDAWLDLKFGRLQEDPDLVRYLQILRTQLAAVEDEDESDGFEEGKSYSDDTPTGTVRASRIESRARLLASFVARQLSGFCSAARNANGDSAAVEQHLELHISAIKGSIQNSIIPIGLLRLGSYLERALLFKVLADRIGLPACLVKGRYGKSWIEISVPTVQADSKFTGSKANRRDDVLPNFCLRENYVVDLMMEPGELLPIGGAKAKIYRDDRLGCEVFSCR